MKVLHVIEGLGRGGAERRLINDLTHLRGEGWRHLVCHLGADDTLAAEIHALGIPVENLRVKRVSDWRTALERLHAVIAAYQPDLIHSQLFWADCYARLLARWWGIPAVVTLQSSACRPGEFLYSRKRHLAEYVLGRWSRCHYVAVSAYVREAALRYLRVPAERIRLIYNSVDMERFGAVEPLRVAALRRSLGLDERALVMLVVGRLDPPKGHHLLFEALESMRERLVSAAVLIVGQGPLDAALKQFVREHRLDGLVRFLGSRGDIRELLALCDLYLFPTKCEGLPLTILEAMAMGKPCVASRIGPIEEIIDDGRTGYLVDHPTSEAWRLGMVRALNDPQRDEVASRGRETIRQRFAARQHAEQLREVYRMMARTTVRS